MAKADSLPLSPGSDSDPEDSYGFFRYNHLGSLAYLSNAAVIDFGENSYLGSITGGILAVYLWRSVYWSQQVSFRTRVMLSVDWAKRAIFGRDLSKF